MKEGVRVFRNNTVFANSIKREYDPSYQVMGAKPGDTIRIQKPQLFSTRSTKAINTQDVTQTSKSLAVATITGIDIKYSSAEMTQDNVDRFNQNKVAPAMATLAAKVDSLMMASVYKQVNQAVTLPVTNLDRVDILNAGVKLDNSMAPRDGKRTVLLPPQGMMDVTNDMSGLFNAAPNVSQQYKDGIVSMPSVGFNFGMSQNLPTHTTGGYDANYDVATAPANGATSLVVDTGTGTIKAGDTFTIDSVFEVNKLTKQSTGVLKQHVVTTDSAGGSVTLELEEGIYYEGPLQNVSAQPAVDDDLVFMGTASTAYPQSLAFHPDAFCAGFADLEIPRGATWGQRVVEDGISMRMLEFYDGINDDSYLRFDIVHGITTVIPDYACRIYGF
jgi:hypothetical protein